MVPDDYAPIEEYPFVEETAATQASGPGGTEGDLPAVEDYS